MKHYFYSEKDQQLGPFTLDELKTKRLKKSTLVWTEGMKDWAAADSLDELKEMAISEPPPLPKKAEQFYIKDDTSVNKINNKYDFDL